MHLFLCPVNALAAYEPRNAKRTETFENKQPWNTELNTVSKQKPPGHAAEVDQTTRTNCATNAVELRIHT
jgi:hypothetical protein